MRAHAVAYRDHAAQIERGREAGQVSAELFPGAEVLGLAAAVAALLYSDHVPIGKARNHLVPDPGVETGGMDKQQRRRLAAQLGPPFEAGHRDAVGLHEGQPRLGAG